MIKTVRIVVLAALAAVGGLAQAAFPERPIELVVPFPVGGGGDLSARIIAAALTERLGQPVRVSNATGAGGVIEQLRKIDYIPFSETVEEGEQLILAETRKKRGIAENSGLKID